jgi:two-component system invasion response regulator UvrY
MKKIKILIVDDHTLIRETWSFILNKDPDFQVIGECGTAEEAIEVAKKLRPDIVILDISLPGMNGLEATPQFCKFYPGIKVLGVSLHTQPTYARQMIINGAMGYITKNSSRNEMSLALKEIYAGRKYICEEIRNSITEQVINKESKRVKGVNDLSPKELKIVGLIKKGYSSKEIAEALFISSKTVEVHRYNMLKKLNLKNTAALVDFINKNYIDID